MNKSMLEIDISGSNNKNDGEDLMKIKLKSQNTFQINFSRFLFHSKYVCEKCSEIMKSIEREIAELENKFSIKEEIIKEFIEIISEDKVFIPIEHYKDIYTLSKHFCIPKLTNLLENMMEKLLVNDLNFSIQILLDIESDSKKEKEEKTELVCKIENFLKARVNECLKNDKFKELPIPTIYRIIDSSINNDKATVDVNNLLDFILESAMNRFILFKFVELHRLRNDKIDEFIKFIDEQEESSKQIYLEYIPFNFLFLKELKHKYDELSKKYEQSKEELKQKKEELKKYKYDEYIEDMNGWDEKDTDEIEYIKVYKEVYECKPILSVQDKNLKMKEGVFDFSPSLGLISIYIENNVYIYKYESFFQNEYESYLFKKEIKEVEKLKFINYLINSRPILCIISKTKIYFYSIERTPDNIQELKIIENNQFNNFINIERYLFFIQEKQLKYINCSAFENQDLKLENINNISEINSNEENILYFIKDNEIYSYDIKNKEKPPCQIINDIPEFFHFCSTINNNIILFSFDPYDEEKLILTYIDIHTKEMKRYSYYYKDFKMHPETRKETIFTCSSNKYPLVFFSFPKSTMILTISTKSITDFKIILPKDDFSIIRPRSSMEKERRIELTSMTFNEYQIPNVITNKYSIITTYGTESVFIYEIDEVPEISDINLLPITNIIFHET